MAKCRVCNGKGWTWVQVGEDDVEKDMCDECEGKGEAIVATCVSCGREFTTSEAFRCNVQNGTIESICGYCDGSHDDGDDNDDEG